MDCSLPGSFIHGIFQARILEWVVFPSPMHESEKWKWNCSVMSDSLRPHGLQPTRLLHPWEFPGKSTGVGCHCLLHDPGRDVQSQPRLGTELRKWFLYQMIKMNCMLAEGVKSSYKSCLFLSIRDFADTLTEHLFFDTGVGGQGLSC